MTEHTNPLTGLNKLCSAIGDLISAVTHPHHEAQDATTTATEPVATTANAGIHPGLTDQQLIVLLTAAAWEVMERPVRIRKCRPLTARDWNWVAQGRSELHTHRLK